MNRLLKHLCIAAICLAASLIHTHEVRAEWQQTDSQWWYTASNEAGYASDWNYIDGEWYYFDTDGWMQTDWVNDNGTWYYLNANGTMQTGWLEISLYAYYLTTEGCFPVKENSIWYYLNQSGAMQTGWLSLDNYWYYLNANGTMQTGWLNDGGTWYYLKGNEYPAQYQGTMGLGFFYDPYTDGYYYATESGALFMGESLEIYGNTYYFKEGGMCTSEGIFSA